MDMNQHLNFTPTEGQAKALKLITEFIQENNKEDFFILLGFAGTGKTSIAKAILNTLRANETEHFINAPTARATKIISQKTGCYGSTMHSKIYKLDENNISDQVVLKYRHNTNEEFAVFIVDEASMVSDVYDPTNEFSTPGSLLGDYIKHVKQGNPKNKIIFIGDNFQLPPVDRSRTFNYSPALSEKHITSKYGYTGSTFLLTEVKRQESNSGVLQIANNIRNSNEFKSYANYGIPLFKYNGYTKGVSQAINSYMNELDLDILDKQTMISYTNKDVHFLNRTVRERLGFNNTHFHIGDFVTFQQNWFTMGGDPILNGDIARVIDVNPTIETNYGQEFQRIKLEIIRTTKRIVLPIRSFSFQNLKWNQHKRTQSLNSS